MTDWGVHLLDMGLWAKDLVEAPAKGPDVYRQFLNRK
jgi:hypothetical protein